MKRPCPWTAQSLLAVLMLSACRDGGDDGQDEDLGSAKFCDAYADLAQDVGCSPARGCSIEAECEDLARAWLACARKDLSQCMCETSGKINCEGSFKPNEGPARCVDEYRAFDVCNEPEDE